MNNDLISRSALIENFKSRLALCNEWIEKSKDKETKIRADATKFFICEVIMTIDNAPTVCNDNYAVGYQDGVKKVLSERPQGKWKALDYHTCYCTNCHFDFDIMKCDFMAKMTFCPNCGADMRGGRE